jgi:hypothetical protein
VGKDHFKKSGEREKLIGTIGRTIEPGFDSYNYLLPMISPIQGFTKSMIM